MLIQGIHQMLPLFSLILIGVVLGKARLLSRQFRREMTDFCFMVLFPASVIDSFNMESLDMEILLDCGKLILVGTVWLAVPFVLALWLTRHMDSAPANVVLFASVYNNFGFAGIGIVSSLYGAKGVFYANMLGLAYRITNMPVGIWMMERGRGENRSSSSLVGTLKSPPVAAMLVMLPLTLLGLRLPEVVYDTAKMLQDCLAPMGMIITGMAVSDFSLRELLGGKLCYLISALRLLVLPALMAGLMLLMKISGVPYASSLLIMGMPVAANCSLLAQKYDADTKLAAQCVLVSTILSLITIPILAAMGGQV